MSKTWPSSAVKFLWTSAGSGFPSQCTDLADAAGLRDYENKGIERELISLFYLRSLMSKLSGSANIFLIANQV